MKRPNPPACLTLLLLLTLPAAAQEAGHATMGFRDCFSHRTFRTTIPATEKASWAPDGHHLKAGGKTLDPLTGKPAEEAEPAPDAAAALDRAMRSALEEELGSGGLGLPPLGKVKKVRSTVPRHAEPNPGVLVSVGAGVAVALVDEDLWSFHKETGTLRRLTEDGGKKRHVTLAPGGGSVSYIRGADLYIARTLEDTVHRLSQDGGENLFYGELDWVYQEEVYGRHNFTGAWWSPDGAHLTFLRIDETGVPTYTVVDHIPYHVEKQPMKYPKAGDTNPRATLHVAGAAGGRVIPVDLSPYEGKEILIVRVGWTPEGDEVILHVQDREQRWLHLLAADPQTGTTRVLLKEESESWVDILDGLRWLDDGDFLWESERTGFKHLYRYSREGELKHTITSGEWQVNKVLEVDEERGEVVFTASRDSAVGDNVYIVGLKGGEVRRITRGRGTHRVTFNGDGTLFLDHLSSLEDPGVQRLCRRDGTVVREVARAPRPPGEKRFGYVTPELISVPARDGFSMDGMLIRPVGFSEDGSYPVWLETYSGPGHPSVKDTWNSSAWFQFLAHHGLIVLQVNVRSASGKGHRYESTIYQQLGLQELADLEDAVRWLTGKPWADAERVGISGYSYGGFMTALALTHSELFRLGVAGGGVYDWQYYDTIYTERYMRTPENNPEGYRKTAVSSAARGLHGHLILHHGTMDENVHVQNVLQLARALQQAGKQFGLMLYPRNRHGPADLPTLIHMRRLTWEAIQRHLMEG